MVATIILIPDARYGKQRDSGPSHAPGAGFTDLIIGAGQQQAMSS